MKIIALVTQKGGSGKSTLAASLAVEMQARGETVFLVDLDPQASLATWAGRRTRPRLAGAAVGPAKLDAVLASLVGRGVTIVIVDTPASLSDAARAAVLAADLVIVPARPTAFDMWSCEATWRFIRDLGRNCAFVLNQCSSLPSSRRTQEGVAALEVMGGLLTPLLTSRVEYQDAVSKGLGPTELYDGSQAADEIRRLCSSVCRRLQAREASRHEPFPVSLRRPRPTPSAPRHGTVRRPTGNVIEALPAGAGTG